MDKHRPSGAPLRKEVPPAGIPAQCLLSDKTAKAAGSKDVFLVGLSVELPLGDNLCGFFTL
jgi:hypothetical protein